MHKIDKVIVVAIILLAISIPFIFVIAATAFVGNGRVNNNEEAGAGALATDKNASYTQAASTTGIGDEGKGDTDSDKVGDSQFAHGLGKEENQTIIKKRIFLGPGESSTYEFDLPKGNADDSSISNSSYDELSMSITVFGSHSVRLELFDKSGISHPCNPEGLCMFVIRGIDNGHANSLVADKKTSDGNQEIRIPIEPGDGYQLKVSNPDSSVSQVVDIEIHIR